MKNKGFTLIELLEVIVILAVIGIITIPLIGNVIGDSKKKALETSVYGLVEAANYFTISNEGVYGFLFNETSKGETEDGQYALSYKGEIDAKGELYIDNNGDISLCLENEDYYVYKNYNSGIYTGEVKDNSCIIGYDAITNKYVAMLDDGTGQVSNVYSKEEVNNLIASVNTNVTNNTNEITSIKESITSLQTDISNYALKTELDGLSSVVNSNKSDIEMLQGDIQNLSKQLSDKISQVDENVLSINETLKTKVNSFSNTSTVSFKDAGKNTSTVGPYAAMDKIHANIANYGTGTYLINAGPNYGFSFFKNDASYYAGLMFSYDQPNIYYFAYCNGTYVIKVFS